LELETERMTLSTAQLPSNLNEIGKSNIGVKLQMQ
jgi:adenine C2-methylase RlmN of 23S rRNA A2503 and tRNA A37